MIQLIRSLFLGLALLAAVAGPARASASSIAELFGLRAIRYALFETAEGRILSERLLGRALHSRGDLELLRARIETDSALSQRVRSQLEELNRRFEAEPSLDGPELLTGVQKSLVRDLAGDLLALDASRAEIEFVAERAGGGGGWNGTRGAFLAPAPILEGYEALRVLSMTPTRSLADFSAQAGIRVLSRDSQGNLEAVARVLSDNPRNVIEIIGDFNQWGVNLRPSDRLQPVPGTPYYEGRVEGLRHGMQYRFRVNGQQLIDPAAEAFTANDHLNSVFWDFGRPGAYRLRKPVVDLREKHVVLGETEIRALVEKWPNAHGGVGPRSQAETYRFIAESGVVRELKNMGYNAVEFVPFNMSDDNAAWAFRYLVYGTYAPDARFGTPDEFAMMIDAFNQEDVAVVMDVVVGHYPFHLNANGRTLDAIGLHQWRKADGGSLYGERKSPWNTNRYDYANPYVRRHLVDGVLTMVKRYGISGLRFDNLDGIRFEPGGNDFLRELHAELRAYRPEVWSNGEMFFGDNNVTRGLDQGGLGLNARTNSDLFDWFKERALGGTESFDMADLRRRIREPLMSWHEGSRVNYLTSHDEAANGRGGFTGEYPATLWNGGGDWWVQRKTETFASLVMTSGSATMDMPQLRLLQRGNFNNNPAIEWGRRFDPSSGPVNLFLADLSKYVGANKAFNFRNLTEGLENHTDYGNRVISFFRTDGIKKVWVLINLNHVGFEGYSFGVDAARPLKLVLSNDSLRYAGAGRLDRALPSRVLKLNAGSGMHGKTASVTVPYLPPMSVQVFEGL